VSGSPILASAARNDSSANDIMPLRKADILQNRTHQGSSEAGFNESASAPSS